MIDVIQTIDELNKVIDKLDNVKSSTDINVLVPGIEDAVDDLRTFRDKIQNEIDQFDKWAEVQSDIDTSIQLEVDKALGK